MTSECICLPEAMVSQLGNWRFLITVNHAQATTGPLLVKFWKRKIYLGSELHIADVLLTISNVGYIALITEFTNKSTTSTTMHLHGFNLFRNLVLVMPFLTKACRDL